MIVLILKCEILITKIKNLIKVCYAFIFVFFYKLILDTIQIIEYFLFLGYYTIHLMEKQTLNMADLPKY